MCTFPITYKKLTCNSTILMYIAEFFIKINEQFFLLNDLATLFHMMVKENVCFAVNWIQHHASTSYSKTGSGLQGNRCCEGAVQRHLFERLQGKIRRPILLPT